MPITVRMLRPDDDRGRFSSNNLEIDRFFQRFAGQNQFRHQIGTTYVAIDDVEIVGYVTVAASQIEIADLPKTRRGKLPRYPLPVLRLARLGVDQRVQRQGLGLLLLRATFALAHQMADEFGCVGVVVDAKPEAVSFYSRYGFCVLEDVLQGALGERPEPVPMFLELSAIPRQ